MEETLIKLKVKKEAANGVLANKILNQFIEACVTLDASIFEPLIEEEQYFQDLDKYRFLQSLKDEFDKVKIKGINQTRLKIGYCQGCVSGHQTHQFFGNETVPEFSYILSNKNNQIEDIFKCNMSSGNMKKVNVSMENILLRKSNKIVK
jgi:hypothetical protein